MTLLHDATASAIRRKAIALAAPIMGAAQVDAIHSAAQGETRRVFADQVACWAFVLTAVALLRVVRLVREDARTEDEELQRLVLAERRVCRRLHMRAQPRARGRSNESALRDLVIRMLVDLYPKGCRAAERLQVASTIAAAAWPQWRVPDPEDLRRDMRRRARRQGIDSREQAYFLLHAGRRLGELLQSA